MKSVGKQLEEARLAKNWTPELAARETKIKVERVRDLEADDYTNFSSPTYARGFVRTYARALNLDEYKILRQLDNKLPEDDNASFANEAGLPYVPQTSKKIHASSGSRTGIYVVLALGMTVSLVIAFVLLEAYRAGELPRYFASTSTPDTTANPASTNSALVVDPEAPRHALPIEPNDTSQSVRALPVDPNSLAPATVAVVAPATTPSDTSASLIGAVNPTHPVAPPRAVAVDPASLTNSVPEVANAVPASPGPTVSTAVSDPAPAVPETSAPAANTPVALDTKTPPRALPVDPSELAGIAPSAPIPPGDSAVTGEPATPVSATAVNPVPLESAQPNPAPDSIPDSHTRHLVLSASRDSFVRVSAISDTRGAPDQILYDSVLRQGQSLAFSGHKFSVHIGVPSAVDITLDGVDYGPHPGDSPQTYTLPR